MNLLERTYATTGQVSGGQVTGALNITAKDASNIQSLVTVAITWMIWIAGIMAFFYLVYSGILYLTAAGNPDAAKKGQQGIINAIIGIVIVILAYTIMTAISGSTKQSSANISFLMPAGIIG